MPAKLFLFHSSQIIHAHFPASPGNIYACEAVLFPFIPNYPSPLADPYRSGLMSCADKARAYLSGLSPLFFPLFILIYLFDPVQEFFVSCTRETWSACKNGETPGEQIEFDHGCLPT